MRRSFTPIIDRDDDWFIANCEEFPGANGQGKTEAECLENLEEAIELIVEDSNKME